MIINDLDLLGAFIRPPEYDPPLIVYSYRVLAGEIASQGFQAVSRRGSEIAEHGGVVELYQFATSDPGNVGRKPLRNTSLLENQLGERPTEAPDHGRLCITV
jgi:hypothetical protein